VQRALAHTKVFPRFGEHNYVFKSHFGDYNLGKKKKKKKKAHRWPKKKRPTDGQKKGPTVAKHQIPYQVTL
jgi:hypothetical protein